MNFSAINHISECFIKPKYKVEESKQPYYLTPWDLLMLSFEYPQNGLFFPKPSFNYSIENILKTLKDSLSLTLVHFYPLAGQLATHVNENRHESLVFLDCNKGPGVKFTYSTLDETMSNILSPSDDFPPILHSLFDHNKVVGHDGHTRPLLSVQVTELLDGIFIGVSVNHVVVDGSTYWHFWNMWSEIHRATANCEQIHISKPLPIHNPRWVLDGFELETRLPFTHPDEFITRYETPNLRERTFHFSSNSIARLKSKANEETNHKFKISSFQALAALLWRSIVRANNVAHNKVTNCKLAINNRHRLNPPLAQGYFGNSINIIKATTMAGELLHNNLGWAALLVNQSVANHSDENVCDFVKEWMKSPFVYNHATTFDPNSVIIANSPRFDVYGNEFGLGLGKAAAVRCGLANKFVGKITGFAGHEGGGSMDFEICLSPHSMEALQSDVDFMSFVSQDLKSKHLSKM